MKLLERLNRNFRNVLGFNKMIQRDQLFVSYCHKDKIWLDRLNPYLSTIENFNGIKAWSDKSIRPGEVWNEEIAKALDSSRVAIFLVSQNFLASKFIMEKEMPYFLELNKNQRTPIFWIAISSCLFDASPLKFIQCANDPNTPLDILSEAEQNKEITKICKKLQTLLKETSSTDNKTLSEAVGTLLNVNHNTSTGNDTVSTKKVNIQIIIDADFDSYSETEIKNFINTLKSLLLITGDIKIVSKKRGSVLLTIELDHKDAEKVYAAINEGRLKHLKAISAKVVAPPLLVIESSKSTTTSPFIVIESSENATDDRKLVHAIINNTNQEAYAELTHRYRDLVYEMLLKLIGDEENALELTRETFLEAFKQLKKYDPDVEFKSWLFAIANKNFNAFIKNKKNNPFSDNITPVDENKEEDSPELKQFHKIMDQLPPHYSRLIHMHYFSKLPIDEIAKRLALPYPVVKSQLARAKKLLATILEESGLNLKELNTNLWGSDIKFYLTLKEDE